MFEVVAYTSIAVFISQNIYAARILSINLSQVIKAILGLGPFD